MRYRVIASPAYVASARARNFPLATPSDLAAHRCVRLDLPDHRSRWLFRDSRETVTEVAVSGDLLISSPMVVLACAVAGMGPALLAEWLVRDELEKGALVDLFPDHAVTATDFATATWLLYPSRAYLPRKVRVVIDFLRNEFSEKRVLAL
jgi:DNA-binding transcriptional LysR family regulator